MLLQRKIAILAVWLSCSVLLSACSTPYRTISAEKDFRQGYYSRAFEKLWMPAHGGNPRAQYALGYLYYYGLGTVRDEDLARAWFRHAAECHYAPAVIAYKRLTNPEYSQYVAIQTRASNRNVKTYKFYGVESAVHSSEQPKLAQKTAPHSLKKDTHNVQNNKSIRKSRKSVKSQKITRSKH